MRYVGTRVPRREDRDLVTGVARGVADLRQTGLLEVAFARSPEPHGLLAEVDLAGARAVPGVVGAWSAADLDGLPVTPVSPGSRGVYAGLDWPALAVDRVRFAGQTVAVVAAERRAVAEDGARAVRMRIEPLAPVTDPRAAAADDAIRLFPGHSNVVGPSTLGSEVAEAFDSAAVVVEGDYREHRVLPSSLEARAILVRPEPGGGLTVWVSHQAPHNLRAALAGAFALEPEQVRVVVPTVGGAFGAKSQTYPEYVVVAHLARLLDRPVRWVEDRREAMAASSRGRGQWQHVRLGADADGRLSAYELTVTADVGAYPHSGGFVPTMTGHMATGAYRTPAVRADIRPVLTTTPPTSSYRGAGRPEAAYAIERTMDRLARRLGLDPAELRRRNFVAPEQFPYETPTGRTYDSGNYAAALDVALEAVDYAGVRAEQARRRREGGRPLGVGLCTYVERSGGPPDSDEFGSVEACPDGSFVARVGSQSTGQGHLTAFAQVVATALDVELDLVRVVQGDTAEVPYGFGSFGSRSMQVGGGALWRAAEGLVDQARRRYAGLHRVDVAQVRWSSGVLRAPGAPDADLADVVRASGPLRVDERFTPPQAFPFGAYAVVVEIDPELGGVEVRQVVAVDDYGVVVNPLIVDGQGYGSVAQGLGQALWEDADPSPDGRTSADSLLDYLLPVAGDLPPIRLEETETPNPNVPFGAKGAGEAGCIGIPPALVNAVCDALDVDHVDMPLTPERVWRAMRDGSARG